MKSANNNTSNLKIIRISTLLKIKNCLQIAKDIDKKSGFRKFLCFLDNPESLINCIVDSLTSLVNDIDVYIPNDPKFFQFSKSRGHLRKKTELTSQRLEANFRGKNLENSLERSIIASVENCVYNQFNLLSGINNSQHEGGNCSIDIIDTRDAGVIKMIELKAWNGSESPLYSFMEIYSYLITYLKMNLIDDNFIKYDNYKIIILAPEDYYKKFELSDPNVFKTFENILITSTEIMLNIIKDRLITTLKKMNNIPKENHDMSILMIQNIKSSFRFKTINIDKKEFLKMFYTKNEINNFTELLRDKETILDLYNGAISSDANINQ